MATTCKIRDCTKEAEQIVAFKFGDEDIALVVCQYHFDILRAEYHRGYIEGIEQGLANL